MVASLAPTTNPVLARSFASLVSIPRAKTADGEGTGD